MYEVTLLMDNLSHFQSFFFVQIEFVGGFVLELLKAVFQILVLLGLLIEVLLDISVFLD